MFSFLITIPVQYNVGNRTVSVAAFLNNLKLRLKYAKGFTEGWNKFGKVGHDQVWGRDPSRLPTMWRQKLEVKNWVFKLPSAKGKSFEHYWYIPEKFIFCMFTSLVWLLLIHITVACWVCYKLFVWKK